MYANNPYTYTVKSSRDSLKLFEDNISYLTIKPKKDEMIVQGKAIYTGVKSDNGAYGKNYYGFDTGHRNYKTTTNTVGGLATFEYGLSDKTSVGFVLGGNNQDINFKGSSKIKGNSLYLGAFTKTDIIILNLWEELDINIHQQMQIERYQIDMIHSQQEIVRYKFIKCFYGS